MLSVDDVTPTPEVDCNASSCRRSSVSCDGDENVSASLTRWGSFRGSMSSLALPAPQCRRESIVEALEKKCRENVSNRLRSQLPQHLQRSSTNVCNDLPVIVRPATAALPRPPTPATSYQHRPVTRGVQEHSRQSCFQPYQGITHGSSLQHVNCLERRHSTTAASRDPGHWTRSLSLSRQAKRDNGDSMQQEDATLATSSMRVNADWDAERRSTLPRRQRQDDQTAMLLRGTGDLSEPRSTHDDRNWAADKRSTLPTRLQPSYDLQSASDVATEFLACGYHTSSSSSTETDRTADCDVDRDSSETDTDSCGEVSVSSFTFSPSTSQAFELSTSSAVTTGSGTRSTEVTMDDSSSVDLAPSGDGELYTTENSRNVALAERKSTNGPLARSDMAHMMGSCRKCEIHNETTRLNETTENVQSSRPTIHEPVNYTPCWNNVQYRTPDVDHVTLMSSTNSPAEVNEPISQSGVTSKAGTQGTSCDRPRYRTSISLSISSPPVSTTATNLLCQSTPRQPAQRSVKPSQYSASESDEGSDHQPPPLPLSAQPVIGDSSRSSSDDEWLEDDEMNGQSAPALDIKDKMFREDNGRVKAEHQRWINSEPENTANAADVPNIKDASDDVTPATEAIESVRAIVSARPMQCEKSPGVTSIKPQSRASNIVSCTTRPATVHNGHAQDKQKYYRSRASQSEATRLNETDADLSNSPARLADEPACKKTTQDNATVHVISVTSVVSQTESRQSRTSAYHFEQQTNGYHDVGNGPSMSQHFEHTRISSVNEIRLEPPELCGTVTSRAVTSSHVTSGSGPSRPVCVLDAPVTPRVTVVPVRTGRDIESTFSGQSVDRSWETLRTDSTRAAFIPHITSFPRVSTVAPQEKTARRPIVVVPVQYAKNTECRRLSERPTEAVPDANHRDEHCVASESGCGHRDNLDIVVLKTGLALGFSIEGGKDSVFGDRPVTVKKVFRDDMKLRAGDEILSANGHPLSDLSHFVALNFLKSLPDGAVHLAVRRDTSSSSTGHAHHSPRNICEHVTD